MIKIERTNPHSLLISERSHWPFLRLLILFSLCALYYGALFCIPGVAPDDNTSRWTLLIFPFFLSPYLLPIWRGLRHKDQFCFDVAKQQLSQAGHLLADFPDIEKVLILTTNSSCEELRLSVILHSGLRIDLYEGQRDPILYELARELANLLETTLESGIYSGLPDQTARYIRIDH